MVGQQQKNLKLHCLKLPKAVLKKRNMDHKINDSKLHIWNMFLSRTYAFKSESKTAKWLRVRLRTKWFWV